METIHKQQGVAIIIVIFVVALISASAILLDKKIFELSSNNALLNQQTTVFQHLHSAKSIVASILLADKDLNYDGEDEDWYTLINQSLTVGIPIDKTTIVRGSISTIDNLLNINNYIKLNQGQIQIRTNPNFNTCLFKLAISDEINITPINDDIIEYLNTKIPKQKLTSVTELKYIYSIPTENYYKIRHSLFALDEVVKININTAPKRIIQCLHNDIDEFGAKNLIDERPFSSIDIAKTTLNRLLPNMNITQVSEYFNEIIATNSNYFLLNLVITTAGKKFHSEMILKRENNKITTVFQTLEYNI